MYGRAFYYSTVFITDLQLEHVKHDATLYTITPSAAEIVSTVYTLRQTIISTVCVLAIDD